MGSGVIEQKKVIDFDCCLPSSMFNFFSVPSPLQFNSENYRFWVIRIEAYLKALSLRDFILFYFLT